MITASRTAPSPGDRYRRALCAVERRRGRSRKLVLIGPGGDLDFTAPEGDALELALSGAPFVAADLKCEKPDELLQRLWAAGYLERLT